MKAWRRLTTAKQQLIVAGGILVAYVTFLYFWGGLGAKTDTQRGPVYVHDAHVEPGAYRIAAVAGGLLLVFVVLGLWAAVSVLRRRGPRFKDLSAAEQARRREAGRLLRQPDDSRPD